MAASEKHYRREQKGGAFIGPLICSGTPTVGSSFVDRFQPALLGKLMGWPAICGCAAHRTLRLPLPSSQQWGSE